MFKTQFKIIICKFYYFELLILYEIQTKFCKKFVIVKILIGSIVIFSDYVKKKQVSIWLYKKNYNRFYWKSIIFMFQYDKEWHHNGLFNKILKRIISIIFTFHSLIEIFILNKKILKVYILS